MPGPRLRSVVLVGASGYAERSLASARFKPGEVMARDHCWKVVFGNEWVQGERKKACEELHSLAA